MNDFEKIAADYANFYGNEPEVSVITGDGAKRFADAIKDQTIMEQDIKFLTIEPDSTAINANDEKASRAVVDVLTKLSEQNMMSIVVVIDKKQERMQGHLGAMMERRVTNITTINSTNSGKFHVVDTKIREKIRPVDEEIIM